MSWFDRIQKYTLNKNNVYIIPSRYGFRYVGINFFLFIIAITYSNNLALLVAFFMVTYFIVQMFSTHRIIFDLSFKKLVFENQFQLEKVYFSVLFEQPLQEENLPMIGIEIYAQGSKAIPNSHLKKLISKNTACSEVSGIPRGKFTLNQIKFFTTGNNKLFYVWRYFKLEQSLYIYPKKKTISLSRINTKSKEFSLLQERDFDQHIRYVSGMPAKRIDWKVYAKTDYLFSKRFKDNLNGSIEISFTKLNGTTEEKLQQMSYLIDKSNHEGISYSILLPNLRIPTNTGNQHFKKSMEAISEF